MDEVADWIEWITWKEQARHSATDLVGEFRRGGGLDHEDLLDGNAASHLEARAEDTFAELEARRSAVGEAYPFKIGDGIIECGFDSPVYLFLLALSYLGKDGAPRVGCGARLFERVCTAAASAYLGGRSLRVGFPRDCNDLPRGFADTLDKICGNTVLGEGGPAFREGINQDKDGGLDVLAWHHFPDRRPGKLILMGQCATGKTDLDSKFVELDERMFQEQFLQRPWDSRPVRAFFFPWTQPDRERWRRYARRGGILFDRCRVAHFANQDLLSPIKLECAQWASAIKDFN